MPDTSASKQIDEIISKHGGWKADVLTQLRAVIVQANPSAIEEVKWRMASRPEGLPVWSDSGIICFAEIWKDNVKLLFPHGAHLKDPKKQFNARLESKDIRAIEYKEGSPVNKAALSQLVSEATRLNMAK